MFNTNCWRFRRRFLCSRYVYVATFCFIVVILFLLKVISNFQVDLYDSSFLEISKCPACYGDDLCPSFQRDGAADQYRPRIHLSDFNLKNAKQVYTARLGDQRVVLKKLAHEWELKEFDSIFCNFGNFTRPSRSRLCDDVGAAFQVEIDRHIEKSNEVEMLLHVFKTGKSHLSQQSLSTDAIHCISERFIRYILNDDNNGDSRRNARIANLAATFLINPEPILLKILNPVSKRFPRLYGTCGRVIVEEYSGKTLPHYHLSNITTRLQIARQLLSIADEMTSNGSKLGFNFYMTDVSFDNFAVNVTGSDINVVLIDVESILITDPQQLSNSPPPDELFYANPFGGEGVLKYSRDDLCSYPRTDHNHYAVCECLLSDSPCSSGMPGGVLWGIPPAMERRWNIRKMIRMCQTGAKNRIKIAHELLNAIDDILKTIASTRQ